ALELLRLLLDLPFQVFAELLAQSLADLLGVGAGVVVATADPLALDGYFLLEVRLYGDGAGLGVHGHSHALLLADHLLALLLEAALPQLRPEQLGHLLLGQDAEDLQARADVIAGADHALDAFLDGNAIGSAHVWSSNESLCASASLRAKRNAVL